MLFRMVEKKFVVDGVKLSYSGPFDILEFYKKVEDWISSKGKEKEIKKKVERVSAKGKKIEWFVEIWEDVADYAKTIVRVQAVFTDVKEIKKDKKAKKLNQGNVVITFDGILESDMEGKWQQKPVFFFLRALADKFIYKFHMNKIEDKLAADTYELHDRLVEFFDSYKI